MQVVVGQRKWIVGWLLKRVVEWFFFMFYWFSLYNCGTILFHMSEIRMCLFQFGNPWSQCLCLTQCLVELRNTNPGNCCQGLLYIYTVYLLSCIFGEMINGSFVYVKADGCDFSQTRD